MIVIFIYHILNKLVIVLMPQPLLVFFLKQTCNIIASQWWKLPRCGFVPSMAITSLVVFKIASEQKKYVAKVSPAQVHDMQGITTAECMVCGNNFHLANPSVLVSWFPSWLVLANILLLFWLTSVICTMTIDWRDNVIAVLQGSVPFFIGLFLLFVRWPVAGIIMELYGSFVLFRYLSNYPHFQFVSWFHCYWPLRPIPLLFAVVMAPPSKPSYIKYLSLVGFCNTHSR